MRVKIEINVDYDEASVSDPVDLAMSLRTEVLSVIHRGMLTPTPTMEEVVDDYDVSILIPSLGVANG